MTNLTRIINKMKIFQARNAPLNLGAAILRLGFLMMNFTIPRAR
ncbi:hypothetical protein CSSP291_10435 [Cronobacter sakazakii SP291]|nr:hypothetical protein CSSP291_10435 [Cronobacter sakazakii SP291]EGL73642.1 hypothetical protein CSE899_04992 [Cronobacter sakazakii E899]